VAAVLTVSVLFPTPPFWLIKVTTAAPSLSGFSFLKWDAIEWPFRLIRPQIADYSGPDAKSVTEEFDKHAEHRRRVQNPKKAMEAKGWRTLCPRVGKG
jgi:hypothetical protein